MEELTDEQLAELQEKAKKVDELEKFKTESEVKLKEYEEAKVELENYKTNIKPNWDKTHKLIENLKKVASDKGVQVDDQGNIVNPTLDVNKIREEAQQAARQELVGNRLGELLGQYTETDAKIVKHHFDKLTAGESVSVNNLEKYLKMAHGAAEADTGNSIKRTAVTFSGGRGPREVNENEANQENVNALGDLMGLQFRKSDKK